MTTCAFVPGSSGKNVFQKIRIETGLKTDHWVEGLNSNSPLANKEIVVDGIYFLSSMESQE